MVTAASILVVSYRFVLVQLKLDYVSKNWNNEHLSESNAAR